MKDRIDEHIEFHEANDNHKSDVAFMKEIKAHIESLEESSLQSAHEWLDDRGVPRSKGDDEYTILSRMQILYSCEVG